MTCSSGYDYVNALRSPLQYFTTHTLTVTLVSTGCLRAKMLVQRPLHSAQRIIVPLTCFVIFVFPKLTKQETMKDCVKGKQFWSSQSFITGQGVCIACPSNWQNCYNEHIDDQKRCVDSCHIKPKPKPKPPIKPSTSSEFSIAPTTSYLPPTKVRFTPVSSIPVVYPSVLHPDEANEKEKYENINHDVSSKLIIAIISALSVFVFLAIAVMLMFLVRRKIRARAAGTQGGIDRNDPERIALNQIPINEAGQEQLQPEDEEHRFRERNDAEQRFNEPNNAEERLHEPYDGEECFQANDAEEPVATQETQPAVQATLSGVRFGGIQDTGEENCSSLHLTEVGS